MGMRKRAEAIVSVWKSVTAAKMTINGQNVRQRGRKNNSPIVAETSHATVATR